MNESAVCWQAPNFAGMLPRRPRGDASQAEDQRAPDICEKKNRMVMKGEELRRLVEIQTSSLGKEVLCCSSPTRQPRLCSADGHPRPSISLGMSRCAGTCVGEAQAGGKCVVQDRDKMSRKISLRSHDTATAVLVLGVVTSAISGGYCPWAQDHWGCELCIENNSKYLCSVPRCFVSGIRRSTDRLQGGDVLSWFVVMDSILVWKPCD